MAHQWGGGRQVSRSASLGDASTHFFRHLKNEFFSRNLGQNSLKMRIFRKKRLKIAIAPGSSAPEPRWPPAARNSTPRSSALLFPLTDIHLSKYVSRVKKQHIVTNSKCCFASSAILRHIFQFKL